MKAQKQKRENQFLEYYNYKIHFRISVIRKPGKIKDIYQIEEINLLI